LGAQRKTYQPAGCGKQEAIKAATQKLYARPWRGFVPTQPFHFLETNGNDADMTPWMCRWHDAHARAANARHSTEALVLMTIRNGEASRRLAERVIHQIARDGTRLNYLGESAARSSGGSARKIGPENALTKFQSAYAQDKSGQKKF